MSFRNYIFIILIWIADSAQSQEPNHFVLGYDQFNGTHVYDVAQDNQGHYWIATNQGLFLHNGYTYERKTCPEMQALSVFNFRSDSRGLIYCYNLKNQIFQIKDEKVELFHEISDSETHQNLFLEIKENQIFLLSKGITEIDSKNKEVHNLDFDKDKRRIAFHVLENGQVVALTGKEIAILSDEHPIVKGIRTDNDQQPVFSAWIQINGIDFAIDQRSMDLYKFNAEKVQFEFQKNLEIDLQESAIRVYQVLDQIWLIGNQKGAYVFDLEWNQHPNQESLYSNYYISDVFQDAEGNVLLSTFGQGILVIPDIKNKSIRLPNDEQITKICADEKHTIFIGSLSGNIYAYNTISNALEVLYSSPNKKPIEFMAYWKDKKSLVYTSLHGFSVSKWDNKTLIDKQEFKGSLKNAVFDEKEGLLALNTGLKRVFQVNNKLQISPLKKTITRAFDVAKDLKNKRTFVSLSEGVFLLKNDSNWVELKYKNKRLISTAMAVKNGELYVGTAMYGILIFNSGRFVKHLNIHAPVLDIIPSDEKLYIRTSHEMFVYSLKNDRYVELNQSGGFGRKAIKDMFLFKNELLLASSSSIIRINSIKIDDKGEAIPLNLEPLLIDGKKAVGNQFKWGKEVYTFKFNVTTLKHRSNIRYRYKLIGYDRTWQYLKYDENSVSYKGLPSGQYEFLVQSLNGSTLSKRQAFSFTVIPPFYETNWFYLLLLLSMAGMFFIVYKYRLGLAQKKNKELVLQQTLKADLLQMELKALRSQMNPHFIFNSLNSIQHLVLKEDTENSYDYLILFAKLVRSTLNYSDLNFIPIHQELEFLEIYLKLEELRFKEEFTYELNYNGTDEIDIPPLIIQPFIENALVHGLFHKKGDKNVSVNLELKKDHLLCKIIDNGVGLEKSKQIQERLNQQHQSFAMTAIQQRLDLMNKHVGENIGKFDIQDIIEDGTSQGTIVNLHLPVRFRY